MTRSNGSLVQPCFGFGDEGLAELRAGFVAFQNEIDQNLLDYEPSSGKMSKLSQNGEIALSVWGSGRLKSLATLVFQAGLLIPQQARSTC